MNLKESKRGYMEGGKGRRKWYNCDCNKLKNIVANHSPDLQVLWLLAQAGERFPQGHSGNPSWNLPERGLSDWRMDEHCSGLPAEWSILEMNKFLIEPLTKKEGWAIDVSWPWIGFYPDIPIRIPGVPLWTLGNTVTSAGKSQHLKYDIYWYMLLLWLP